VDSAEGLVTEVIARHATADQATKYIYGVKQGETAAIYRTDLLRAVIYPNSDYTVSYDSNRTLASDDVTAGNDRVEYDYTRTRGRSPRRTERDDP
jgi:hypothetical protein